MGFINKFLKRDNGEKPIPQYFNPASDDFEAVYGRNGAIRSEMYDASGNAIGTTANPFAVKLNGSNAQPISDTNQFPVKAFIAENQVLGLSGTVDMSDRAARQAGIMTVGGYKRYPVKYEQDQTATVNATSGTELITITPTAGRIGRLLAFGAFIPLTGAGATGNHAVYLLVGSASGAFSHNRLYTTSGAGNAALVSLPQSAAAAIKDVLFTTDNPLKIGYDNTSSVNQTGTRKYFVLYEEIPVS